MRKTVFFIIAAGLLNAGLARAQTPIDPSEWSGMTGYWTFDDPQDLTRATIGNDLELVGQDTAVAGPSANDGATRIGVGSYYKCYHDIPANGGGTYVNRYTFLVDFRVPSLGKYYAFYQTNDDNTNDGDLFVNPEGHVGLVDLGGYSYCRVDPGEWYRLVVSVDLGHHYRIYLDGQLIQEENPQTLDGRFSLYTTFFNFFADENGEDNMFDVAAAAVFNYPLTSEEVEKLGGYGHVMPQPPSDPFSPYLQNVTDASAYISWYAASETAEVYFSTDSSSWAENKVTSTYEDIAGVRWHTVHLTGLSPDTRYYYRCISDGDTSTVYHFRTAPAPGSRGHLRFVVVGDSRTDTYQTHYISTVIEQQLIHDFGTHWSDSVRFVIHVGDIVTSGDQIAQYKNEYFLPYSNLTAYLPFYVSIGNHENESAYYYAHMKYEDLTGAPYDDPSSKYNEKFYTFRYGRCQFIALNTNGPYLDDVQYNWFKGVLDAAEADGEVERVIIFFHHPGHTEVWPSGNNFYVQLKFLPLISQYNKPAIIFYGHSHDYEHGTLIPQNTGTGYSGDIHLVLSGGGGAGLDRWGMYYNQRDYGEIHMSLDHYNYSIVDMNMDDGSYTARTYSLGHLDRPLNNVLVDSWYSYPDQPAPSKPVAREPVIADDTVTLVASPFEGVDSLFSSQIQVTATPGDYSSPVISKKRDVINLYGDTGAPDYLPVNRSAGIDLTTLKLPLTTFSGGETFAWRIRYRDHNMKWSEWSEEVTFTVTAVEGPEAVAHGLTVYPNPAGVSTTIAFTLQRSGKVTLSLHALDSREVAVLMKEVMLPAGRHTRLWEPDGLPAGLYILRLTTPEGTSTCKVMVKGK